MLNRKVDKSKPIGALVLPEDYLEYGSSKAIRNVLDRLEGRKVIIRYSVKI
jgi:hypothetical protein